MAVNKKFEVIVMGGGPAGYVAAIKSAQLGKTVVCIDDNEFLGGTCLNVGCIPSKFLLNATHQYYSIAHDLEKYGLEVEGEISFSLKKMMDKKHKTISDLARGIDGLFKKYKIERIVGKASFVSSDNPKEVLVSQKDSGGGGDDDDVKLIGDNVIIATGSSPFALPKIEVDGSNVITSTEALELDTVPKHMVIVGAGVIGLEMGSVWSRLGSKVTVIEYKDRALFACDPDVSKEAQKIFAKQGINFLLSHSVNNVDVKADGDIIVNVQKAGESAEVQEIGCDKVLIAVGRVANTGNIGLENIGMKLDDKGRIIVDDKFQTNIGGIYAVGDVIDGPMLAHKASEEAVAVAEIISGRPYYVNRDCIASIIYTHPEIATIGRTEAQLQKNNIEYKVGKFPFIANSRAKAISETEGFVKIIASKSSGEVLGASIIGGDASEMIQELATAMEFGATADDVASISHGHPTFSEAVKEAALAIEEGAPIHG